MIAVLVAAVSFLAGLASIWLALYRFGHFGAGEPDERSNHKRPTPQIGGIAIAPVWIAAMIALSLTGAGVPVLGEPVFLAAFVLLLALGVVDDRKALGPFPKLLIQAFSCVLATVAFVPLLNAFPVSLFLSAPACALFLLILVNLTNFIDGLDLMAVATVGVPSAGFALFAATGVIGSAYLAPGLTTAALFAAFAIYNWHPARTFLGDGGSLPFGLLLGAMTVIVAAEAGLLIAALLPAYILFDGGLTLVRRSLRRENLLRAHSSHLYQRAFRSGRSALPVSAAAATFGAAAIGLAALAAMSGSYVVQTVSLVVACAIWAALEMRMPMRR